MSDETNTPSLPTIAFTIAAIMLIIAAPLYCSSLDLGGVNHERSPKLVACLSISGGALLVVAAYRLHKRVRADRSAFVPEYGEHLLIALGLGLGGLALLCLGAYLLSLTPT